MEMMARSADRAQFLRDCACVELHILIENKESYKLWTSSFVKL